MESSNTPSDDEIKELRRKVDSNPIDFQSHFDLGVALSKRHEYAAAIMELQKAQLNPNIRWPSMKLLAEMYDAKGMSEFAARVRKQLSRESGEDDEAGSAPVPAPKRPITPLDSSHAEKYFDEDDHSI
jgi:hypothetical protein